MTFSIELRPPVRPSAVPSVETVDVDPSADADATFPQSVASGGPTPTGVVLWTRVAPDAHDAGTPLALTVADDPAFESIVERVEIPAVEVDARHDHTVRVDLDGSLDPDSRYYYQFVYDGVASRVGRCRTLPVPDASPERVRFAVVSCQHYQNGYFGAFHHVAAADVDFVLHLGDYIYEAGDDHFRAPGAPLYPGRDLSLPSGHGLAWTLPDFRELYRTYHADRFLQAAHERHTFVRTWDDHTVANNRYWDYEADAPAAPDHPRGDDHAFVRRLTADGIQAWWEFTPSRVEYDPDAAHLHDAFRLYRELQFGDLVTLLLTDERLYRCSPPCSDGSTTGLSPGCPERRDSDRTMLGDAQLEWFLDAVGSADSRWTAWANEVLSMPFRVGVGPASLTPNLDAWDGYPVERERVFEALGAAENAVTLTGDMHTALAGRQHAEDGTPVGVEFMTPAVTSVNLAEAASVDRGLLRRLTRPLLSGAVRAMNPHLSFFDSHDWGYSVATFTREDCTFTTYAVDKTVDADDADRRRLARFRVPAGSTELHRKF